MGIYLDNAATSYPKPKCVFEAMRSYLEDIGANAGRSAHRRAIEASTLVFETRELIAQFLGIKDSSRIIFTSNATEALNLAILGLEFKSGDCIITSSIEHNSVMRPLRYLEKEKKIKIEIVKCSQKGEIDPSDVRKRMDKKTKLIIMNHASNVIGTIFPIKELLEIAREYNKLLLVDAAQSIGTIPININENKIDLLAFSGHKGLLGPPGTGCLYIREGIELKPLKFGGTGSHSASILQPEFFPDRYESGTLNLPGIAGLKASVGFIMEKGIQNIQKNIKNLTDTLIKRLSEIPGVVIYGTPNKELSIGVVSINIKNKEPSEVAEILDKRYDIGVRAGLHCAPQAHKTIRTYPKGTVRLSLGKFNTKKDIEILCEALWEIVGS